ncbi:N-acetylglucosamine-6-phosphate deacetylase [Mesorhizobium sp. B2-5-12]|uniref:N-acetylglucosamine-6-phosphate deacetylase n=2 Tax=Mesorhizobium TaxID=68287 RepID=UPI001FEDBFD4|nr:N-acetylglucosamine-6-phosphate deacetylase [Mesorhizobium sp. B2-5-12]
MAIGRNMITPGLVDMQVNGFAGVDFNSGTLTAAELDEALEALLACGVTACLPTIITARPDELSARFSALDKAVSESRLGPLMCPGYHLEGPFLNPAPGYSGCHPASAMTAADPALIERLQSLLKRPILLTTLAPEVEGGIAFIRAMNRHNILVSIGHSACGFELVAQAAAAGAVLSTHLGNGLPQTLPKLDNTLFAQLAEDRLAATFIADGIHVPPGALKSLVRAKGLDRSVLVTDAVSAAGAPHGSYEFAGMRVESRADGSVRVPGGIGLAGSALRLDDAVRNLVRWGIAGFAQAVDMASANVMALLQPVLDAHGLRVPASEIEWAPDMTITRARVGEEEREYDRQTTKWEGRQP